MGGRKEKVFELSGKGGEGRKAVSPPSFAKAKTSAKKNHIILYCTWIFYFVLDYDVYRNT